MPKAYNPILSLVLSTIAQHSNHEPLGPKAETAPKTL